MLDDCIQRDAQSISGRESAEHLGAPLTAIADGLRGCVGLTRGYELISEAADLIGISRIGVGQCRGTDSLFGSSEAMRLTAEILGWPVSFIDWWQSHNMVNRNADLIAARSSMLPFKSIILHGESLTHEMREVANRLIDSGVSSSLVVPVHCHGGAYFVAWTGSAYDEQRDRLADVWPLLMAVSHSFVDCVKRTVSASGAFGFPLTARQRECLTWISRGKTVGETATIMQLSPHTVEDHLSSAAKRLKVGTRAELLVKACINGLLTAEDIN